MKKHLLLAGLLAALGLAATTSAQTLTLQPRTSFGPNGDGSLRPDQADPSGVINFTSDGTAQRSLAYNPTTGHLLFVSRTNYTSPSDVHIYVLDGATGTNILDGNNAPLILDITSNFATGGNASFPFNLIAVANDGSIYACNLSSASSPPQVRLYRWANETAPQELVYFGDPGNGNSGTASRRWGDTIAIRGGGINTQILLASRGSLAAILTPTDVSLSSFSATTLNADVAVAEAMGYGLAFGAGNTFWAKGASAAGMPLLLLSFNTNAGTATTIQSYSTSVFPGRVGPFAVSNNVLVAIEPTTGADPVRLYDVSNTSNPPQFLDRKLCATNLNNNIFAGAVAFGTNGTIYALDTDNGIIAFNLVNATPAALAPAIFLNPISRTVFPGSNVTFTVAADGTAPLSYQWRQLGTNLVGMTSSSYTLNNAQLADNAKTFTVVVSNSVGSVTSSVATLTVTTQAPFSVPGTESFDYTAGAPLGTNNGWTITGGTSGTIEAGSLSVPGLRPARANKYSWGSSSGVSHRLPFAVFNSGTVYFSLALRVDSLGGLSSSSAGTVGGFADGTSTLFGKLNILANGAGGYKLGTSIRGAAAVYATGDYNVGDTVFVVGRYTFNPAANDDVMDIWLNPPASTFEAGAAPVANISASGTATAGDLASFDRFFFRGVTTSIPEKIVADELRIGLTWADVTPVPIPALNIAPVGNNFSISWMTNNAANYVLQSTANLTPPTNWSDVTNVVTALGTNYTTTLNNAGNARYFRLIK